MVGLLLALIYLSFISLGLPDAVTGSAWPVISEELGTPVSNMGIITIIIAMGTITSSLNSSRLVKLIGVHKVVVFSILTTAISLVGFAYSESFLMLCLWAIPYGLGAGSVDVTLNSFVAVTFESKHMSWLHCMWGVGATLGPYIMGSALTGGYGYSVGYMILFAIQAVLSIIILLSSPIFKAGTMSTSTDSNTRNPSIKELFGIPGVVQIAVAFFCFCAIENTIGIWAGSYLVFNRGMEAEAAAGFSALYYLGITIGRGICGFIAMKYNDTQMIRAGSLVMAIGVATLFLPLGQNAALVGLMLTGLGSAPIFPCIIHSAPINFGVENSHAITGVQMASAYLGILVAPPLFGAMENLLGFEFYPLYNGFFLVLMVIMYELMIKKLVAKKTHSKIK